jgi:hypothetical protein
MAKPIKLLRRAEVSQFLKDEYGITRSAATLGVDSCRGAGPIYSLMQGRAYYKVADVVAWAEAQIAAATPRHPKIVHKKARGRPRKIANDGAVVT